MLIPTILAWLLLVAATHGTRLNRIVSTNRQLFTDDSGRTRVLRGTNVVAKAFPYIPDTRINAIPMLSFNKRDVAILALHGTTAIRLGVIWAGVEPNRGQYNSTYLNELKSIVQMCSDAGIYVLLDFHQDLFSERFCGNGAPLFASKPAKPRLAFPVPLTIKPYELDENQIPSTQDCASKQWALYQGSWELCAAYQGLYDNAGGVRDSFVDFWKLVAATFLPFSNILGYDIINEPWNGDIFKDSRRLDSAYANKNTLQPFYEIVSAGIRSVDANALIFFEPVALIQKDAGFTSGPGGINNAPKNVFNFHFYSNVQRSNLNATIAQRLITADALSCGAFLSEFEMGAGAGPKNIETSYQAADAHLLSATGWEYKDYVGPHQQVITGTNNGIVDPETGEIRRDMAAAFSRTYAHAIAGVPTAMRYIDLIGEFSLDFVYNGLEGLGGVTEIRTNFELHYPGGFLSTITSTSGSFTASAENDPGRNCILITPDSGNAPLKGASVRVLIRRKSTPHFAAGNEKLHVD
ncbi:glycoside hydrolase superfamily [Chytriomyces cf. hyalinus JEL632]|nr:glycoside hydrolase superfamily [Chytriomyces cf. hyalinus JEL632]